MKLVIPEDVQTALRNVGVKRGQAIMVHTSLSSLGYVCGGAQTIIEALLHSVGQEGTIMMPTQSWKNLDPTTGVYWQEPKEWWPVIREYIPAYDDYAKYLTEKHSLSDIFGDGSPIGRLYELDGAVLLIGVGYDKNTSLHLADARAEYPGKHTVVESSAIQVDGQRVWKSYETLAVDGEDFPAIGEAFEQTGQVRHVSLGDGILSMMSQRALVDFAVEWMNENRK